MKRFRVFADVLVCKLCAVIEAESAADARAQVEAQSKELLTVRIRDEHGQEMAKSEVIDYFLEEE